MRRAEERVFSFERRGRAPAPHLRLVVGLALASVLASFAVAAAVAPAGTELGDRLLVGAVFSWPIPLLLFAGWGLALPLLRQEETIADATLDGSRLEIRAPGACAVDLAEDHALVLSIGGAGASIRVLRDDGDVRLEFERGYGAIREWVPSTDAPRSLRGDGVGSESVRRAAGDALVERVLAARPRNRFERELAALRRRTVATTDLRAVVTLDGSPFDSGAAEAGGYRTSEPEPGEAGYLSLVRSTGHRLEPTLAVGPAHLVARTGDGRWRALPIDGCSATRVQGGLRLVAAGVEHDVATSPAVAEAVVLWLRERGALGPRPGAVEA